MNDKGDMKQYDWSDAAIINPPRESEQNAMLHSIVEWRNLNDTYESKKRDLREITLKKRALEKVILEFMKKYNIMELMK
jgi:hypothetical protein